MLGHDLADGLGLHFKGILVRSVDLQNQTGFRLRIEGLFLLSRHGVQTHIVNQFRRGWHDIFLQHRMNSGAAVIQRPEKNLHDAAFRRHRNQPQNGLGHNTQGPFRTDHQLGQIIAGDIFDRLAAGLNDVAIGENYFQPHDIVAGDAIFDGAHPAGILGDIAADEGIFPAGRVRRIEQPFLGAEIIQVHRPHAGFGGDHHIFLIQLQNVGHPVQGQYDAALQRNASPAPAAGCAARSYENFVGVSDLHDRRHFLDGAGPDHDLRFVGRRQRHRRGVV